MSRTPLLFDALLFCDCIEEKNKLDTNTIIPNAGRWMRKQYIALTATCSLELPDAHRPLFADTQKWHHTYDLCALHVCVATYQAVQSTPTLYECMSVNPRLTRTNSY